jgi:hypothetical protein
MHIHQNKYESFSISAIGKVLQICHFLQQNTDTSGAILTRNNPRNLFIGDLLTLQCNLSVLTDDKRDISTNDNRDKYQEGFSTDFYGIKLKGYPKWNNNKPI